MLIRFYWKASLKDSFLYLQINIPIPSRRTDMHTHMHSTGGARTVNPSRRQALSKPGARAWVNGFNLPSRWIDSTMSHLEHELFRAGYVSETKSIFFRFSQINRSWRTKHRYMKASKCELVSEAWRSKMFQVVSVGGLVCRGRSPPLWKMEHSTIYSRERLTVFWVMKQLLKSASCPPPLE